MSASMGADFPMIPHESTLFSRGCKSTSLGIVPYQVTGKAAASQTPGGGPWFVAPQGRSGEDRRAESHLFLCTFMGHPSEASMKCGRNSTTEKSDGFLDEDAGLRRHPVVGHGHKPHFDGGAPLQPRDFGLRVQVPH